MSTPRAMSTPRRWLVALTLAAIVIAAGAGALATMRAGVGLTNDSRAYLGLANGLATRATGALVNDDDILTRRFPPLYPAILASIDLATGSGLTGAARLLDVACLAASTLLVAAIVWDARRSAARALLAAALFAAGADVIDVHVNLWSESTFGVWMLLGTLALARYLRDGSRRWLLATALLATCAILTRYAGVALVLAQAATILFRSPRPRRSERLADAVVFGLVPAVALLLWSLSIPQNGAGVGHRDVTLEWIGWPKLDDALGTFGGWIAGGAGGTSVARVAGVAAIVVVVVALIAGRRLAAAMPAIASPWAFCCVYPPFLLVSITFVDPATPLDRRILEPLHAMVILLACATLGPTDRVGSRPRAVWAARAMAGVAIALLVAQVVTAAGYLGEIRQTGLGYASLRWREHQTLRAVGRLPDDVPLFSTHRTAIELITNRHLREVPYWRGETPPRSYDLAALSMLDAVREAGGRGYLIYVRRPAPTAARHFLSASMLQQYVQLQRIANLPDGRIYKILGIVNDVRHAPTTAPSTNPSTLPTARPPRVEPDDAADPPAGPASPEMPTVD